MINTGNSVIRKVAYGDKEFWLSLDKHISESEFEKKVRDKQGYVLRVDNKPVGILRYNLFWDNTPFCTLLYILENYRKKGYGRELMSNWESDMQALGYEWVLISTQCNEDAQYFYRRIGYKDCGSLNAPGQPAELFLLKFL